MTRTSGFAPCGRQLGILSGGHRGALHAAAHARLTLATEEIFVGSDGHIAFGEPNASSSARDAGRHIGGPPRISPLFADLDPSSAGAVHADVRADRVVISWNGVPELGESSSNTVQVVLHASGGIDMVYANVELSFAVVHLERQARLAPRGPPATSTGRARAVS